MRESIRKYASEFARLGGLTKSPKRAAASRKNGKLGGRPRIEKNSAPGQGI
jgi:hypothetical protein